MKTILFAIFAMLLFINSAVRADDFVVYNPDGTTQSIATQGPYDGTSDMTITDDRTGQMETIRDNIITHSDGSISEILGN